MSTNWQQDVEDFHRETQIDIGGSPPAVRRGQLRAKLIMEEAAETAAALTGETIQYQIGFHDYEQVEPDSGVHLCEAIDGIVDTIVVSLGTAIEMGIQLQPFWDEVHRTNMAKANGPKRADGKQLKPPGWTPPDIFGVLVREHPELAVEGDR